MSIGLLAALAGALLVATPAHPPEARATPHEAFDRGRTAFGRAEYKRAIELLHPLLYPEVLLDSEGEVVQAHRMLGVSYLFSGPERGGEARVPQAARAAPRLPVRSAARSAAGGRRLQRRGQGGGVRDRGHRGAPQAPRRRRSPPGCSARRGCTRPSRRSSATNATPTSSTSSPSGRASSRTASGARDGSSSAWRQRWRRSRSARLTTNFALYGASPTPQVPAAGRWRPAPARADQSTTRKKTPPVRCCASSSISGGLFFAAAIWGVVDAVRHYQRDVLMTEPAAPPPPAVHVGLTPLGLSAALSF